MTNSLKTDGTAPQTSGCARNVIKEKNLSKFYEPLKTIVEKDDWKIVEENEHTLACSCNGLNGWAISGMSVVEYSQRRLAFFRDNRLIGEIKLYDLDLAGRVVDEYMTGGFTPTMFISLDTTMEQWCQQIEDAYAGVLTGLEEEEDTDAGSQ